MTWALINDITWALITLVYCGAVGFLFERRAASMAEARLKRRRERAEATRAADNELGKIALRRKYLRIAEECRRERDWREEQERRAA